MKNLIHVKSISKLIHKYENLDLEMFSKINTKVHEKMMLKSPNPIEFLPCFTFSLVLHRFLEPKSMKEWCRMENDDEWNVFGVLFLDFSRPKH